MPLKPQLWNRRFPKRRTLQADLCLLIRDQLDVVNDELEDGMLIQPSNYALGPLGKQLLLMSEALGLRAAAHRYSLPCVSCDTKREI